MIIHSSPLSGVVVVESVLHADSRGVFSRYFCAKELSSVIGERKIVNINYSLNTLCGHNSRSSSAEGPSCRDEIRSLHSWSDFRCGR